MIFKIEWKKLITSVALCLGTGFLSALITRGDMDIYDTINKPPLAPPGWLFPVAWTIIYLLMGVSLYLVRTSNSRNRKTEAYAVFFIQLFLNFIWSPIFFSLRAFLVAFIVLVLMWIAILAMILLFRNIRRAAGYINIPYLIWVTFAGYLNLAIYLLN